MVNITKAVVEAAKAPARGQVFIRDSKLQGLAIRIIATGAKSFVFEGRIRGKMRRITIGRYPLMTVAQARKKVFDIKTAINQGRDPRQERHELRKELTLGEFAGVYLVQHAKPHKRTWMEDDRMIRNYFSGFTAKKLTEITANEVVRLHKSLGAERGQYAANRSVVLLRTMYNLARRWGYFSGDNPADGIRLFHEEKRDRFLSPEELKRVNQALRDEPNEFWRAYFWLSLLLGSRKSELLSARWADIDFEQGTWKLPMTKAGRSHLLPLPKPALEILRSLPSSNHPEFVFPGKGGTGHLVEPKNAWRRIRRRAGVQDVHIHDLRRTLGSWLVGQGYGLPLIGRALNHSKPSTTAIYARLDIESVRAALEKNAALMLGSVVGA